MSKELVISAASHERRVAILEEGQLVEIYIEREKEFALVGSIYKGKVTRVLPGMQSAFVDIGLDGDAFLYVSDVFENLEDYEHSHPQEQQVSAPVQSPGNGSPVEILPGETLARATQRHEQAHLEESHPEPSSGEPSVQEGIHTNGESHLEEVAEAEAPAPAEEAQFESSEERQPDSNASAPQDFSPRYNPTQNYSNRSSNERQGQSYGRGGDRGGDRGRGGRWGAIAVVGPREVPEEGISRRRNTLRRKAVNPAAMIIVGANATVTTVVARKARAVQVLL
jgi:ribonuclease G